MYDQTEQFAMDAEHCVAVLGKGEDFVLIDVTKPISEDATAEALARGFQWCGLLGIAGGTVGARCEPGSESLRTMVHAGLAWAQIIADKAAPTKGDAVLWLEALYQLPDTRDGEVL